MSWRRALLAKRFENGRLSARDLLRIIAAGLRGAGLDISDEDVDRWRNTHSRLRVGTQLRRDEMLLLALMSSENRAALALSRHFPGGRTAFLAQMNRKAAALGMANTHFADSAGLSNQSMSTANDLHKLLNAAYSRPLIRSYTTQVESTVVAKGRLLTFINSNRLVRSSDNWDIELQKTGFTNEAGRCLVMQVNVKQRRLAMIFLDSNGTMTRYADAARVRKRVEREAGGIVLRLGIVFRAGDEKGRMVRVHDVAGLGPNNRRKCGGRFPAFPECLGDVAG
mgnify:CR=1 FL=1